MTSSLKNRVLDRYGVLSVVFSKQLMGLGLREAILETTKLQFYTVAGEPMRVSSRSIYRWIAAYKREGLVGIAPMSRVKEGISPALSPAFVDFLVNEKKIDGDASIPDIIRRAEIKRIIQVGKVSRSTAWRAARKLNLPIFSDKRPKDEDMRRFAHPNRMVMVLCDGKHFRAGAKKRKRVAFFYLDDCSRRVITAVVGKSESVKLFLRGLYATIEKAGLMDSIYLDRGSGFKAKAASTVCARIGINYIQGRARYPPGHGKIERFNQTCLNDLLRSIAQDPTIDPECNALEYRINHYIAQYYNLRAHEGIDGLTPEEKWARDSRPLRFPHDRDILTSHFIITTRRRVSRDNVVMIKGKGYEMPSGYAGLQVDVFHWMLEDRQTVIHNGKHMRILPVDLQANARAERRRRIEKETPQSIGPVKTAAQLLFERDHQTIVTAGGELV
jgi:putative transposase